ncbi:MAG: S41 family peptidase [Breznakibacter sp.]
MSAKSQFVDKEFQKFQMAWNLISTFYVDSVDKGSLAEEAIVAMLQKLDPHSVYISAKEVEAMNEPLNGSFEGIGIEFHILNDTLMVVNTIPGGPSENVGIKAGDRILSIDGKNVAGTGLKNSDVFKMLRGPKGTQVLIAIQRKGSLALQAFNVTRGQIPIFSIDAAYMASPQTGYIKINRFASTTYDEFVEALKKLQKHNLQSLILDLRGNGGGYLNAAIEIADEFLGNRKLIVFTQGLNSPRRDYFATSRGLFEKGQLVVLIDEGSASASEIVAGAVQDHDRGMVIGRRSFGKGLVQRPFTLPDGANIRLTTAKYYTPSGRCIQKPYDEGTEVYLSELYQRVAHGELLHSDSIKASTGAQYKTLAKGRNVYGGGGIMPDKFVPADTSMFSEYYRDVVAKGIINKVALEYTDANRGSLAGSYPSLSAFTKKFTISGELVEQMKRVAEKENIKFKEEDFKRSELVINTQLRAIIARDLWGTSAYFEVINPVVNTYQEALNLIENKELYNQLLNTNEN